MTANHPMRAGPRTIDALAGRRLGGEFYRRDALAVARDLIGTVLVHRQRAGIIVETEAYLGPEDLASHARFGPTARTSVMFGPGGFAYVYLCYGVHEMFNIVTGRPGEGQAVLIRAIAPYAAPVPPGALALGRGPGKLTRALAIDRRHDRRDLTRGALFVAGPDDPPPPIATGPRVGVDYAGADWAARRFRFWWRDHSAVSRAGRPPPPTVSTRRSR